ncbi:MAG: nickel pincer cofactor biosynthesis protein LarC, partial [Candidatus Heimdallarchaeota archaeon]|nr:nickel pincer cofactor biosynthesis protein LarC [Candidatus Heimdallarchaeota archaeon]
LMDSLMKVLDNLDVSVAAKNKAQEMLTLLFQAESRVHDETIEKLHLHETASVDTILDIVGTIWLLEKHGLLNIPIYGLPVNVGSGFITFSHGKVSVPPPAVLEILQKLEYPFFSDEVEGELLTPTGIILLGGLVSNQINQLPPLRVQKIGYGAGNKDLPSRSNVLRILLVDLQQESTKHYLSMLETHLDDVTGEILGGIVNELMNQGALDVSYYPLIMKKNRPAWCLRVICDEDKSSLLAKNIMKELGTLGVREGRFGRYELERRVITKKIIIKGKSFTCRFKERMLDGEIVGVKPEFEDIASIATETKIPINELEIKLVNLYYEGSGNYE